MKEVRLKGLTWDDPRGRGPLRAVEKAYAAARPRISLSVRWDRQPLSGFESRPLSDVVDRYDLLVVDHPHMANAAQNGYLLPVGELEDQFVGQSLNSYEYRGQYWAVPIDAACHVTAYRSDRLDKPPCTWDDVEALASSGVRLGIPLAGVHALMAFFTLIASQQGASGGPVLEEFSQGEADDALQRLRWLRSTCARECLAWNPIDALEALDQNLCDCVLMTFGYARFRDRRIRFAPVPAFSPYESGRGVLGGTGMAVSASSRHAAEALDFARFCGTERVQRDVWPTGGGQPAHRAAWDSLAENDLFYSETRSAVESAVLRPRSEGLLDLQTVAGATIERWLSLSGRPPTNLYSTLQRLQSAQAA